MKLRHRDIIASLLAAVLAHIAWSNTTGSEPLSVSIDLAFYTKFQSYASNPLVINDKSGRGAAVRNIGAEFGVNAAKPVPFDVDGDGIVEAIVVPSLSDDGGWKIEILDLKPLHSTRKHVGVDLNSLPFQLQTMFRSNTKEGATNMAVPIKITTGQIILHEKMDPGDSTTAEKVGSITANEDRTKYYYCGIDWFDAGKCQTHCPSGSSNDCPSGEQCYADIPCEKDLDKDEEDDEVSGLVKTPRGGLPSIVTVWSDGGVTLHSLTADLLAQDGKENEKKKRKMKHPTLELREMWYINPFQKASNGGRDDSKDQTVERIKSNAKELRWIDFHELDIILDTNIPIGRYGAVILAARYSPLESEDKDYSSHRTGSVGNDFNAAMKMARMKQFPMLSKLNPTVTSYHAIDAFSGDIIWSHRGNPVDEKKKREQAARKKDTNTSESLHREVPTSSARRRSIVTHHTVEGQQNGIVKGAIDDTAASEDCLDHFRHWIMHPSSHAVPHSFWKSTHGDGIADDSELVVTHFDRKHQYKYTPRGLNNKQKEIRKSKDSGKKVSWISKVVGRRDHRREGIKQSDEIHMATPPRHNQREAHAKAKHATPLQYVRPNVVLFHNHDGISALSLKNGRPVCHLSLMDNSLYADINHDGIIDHIQVILDNWTPKSSGFRSSDSYPDDASRENDKLVLNMKSRVKKSDPEPRTMSHNDRLQRNELCNALVLSGIPAREEVFNAFLCNGSTSLPMKKQEEDGNPSPMSFQVHSAPPLLLEAFDEHINHKTNDIVFALNTGNIIRYDSNGKMQWQITPGMVGIPTWEGVGYSSASIGSNGAGAGYLSRISFPAATTHNRASLALRPILITGEDGMAILSSGKGHVLAHTSFPQSSIGRPILADMSGDGTMDVMVISNDAIWGYRIMIGTHGSSFIRIMVILLMLGIGLAALYNKFSQLPGIDRRSTDI